MVMGAEPPRQAADDGDVSAGAREHDRTHSGTSILEPFTANPPVKVDGRGERARRRSSCPKCDTRAEHRTALFRPSSALLRARIPNSLARGHDAAPDALQRCHTSYSGAQR